MTKTRISKAPEERRAELIAAARYLFDKNGVEKTRVSDIVSRVGVAQGVFYYYFRSKDEIVEVAAEEVIAELKTDIQTVMENQATDFYKKLAELIELYFDLIDQFTGDDEMVLPDFSNSNNKSIIPVQKAREILIEQIIKLVMDGAAKGYVKARYPEWSVWTLESGLCRVALQRLPTREIVYTLVEDALCLPTGKVVQYCQISAKQNLHIKEDLE